ncbi:hypothetical protein WICMUC_000483 [Wickerhamomyces mucosus]|uniref:Uncharacterized protein n=1 Tax=Wickerhamomyces mucosus TaxID=1378264 RepID=A0A9P8PXE7_9ASCO|nr:hypothetical protein WICMUC_000483 [Wickerhamomyces mucosus]
MRLLLNDKKLDNAFSSSIPATPANDNGVFFPFKLALLNCNFGGTVQPLLLGFGSSSILSGTPVNLTFLTMDDGDLFSSSVAPVGVDGKDSIPLSFTALVTDIIDDSEVDVLTRSGVFSGNCDEDGLKMLFDLPTVFGGGNGLDFNSFALLSIRMPLF